MPIYEFFCSDCRTVFNFFSPRIDTQTRPRCPRCDRPRLERWLSPFAAPSGREKSTAPDGGPASPEENRMEQALEHLAGEAESLPDDDPRQAAALMRRFSEMSGMPLTDSMREALQRLESGEDPNRIEEEMGDLLEEDDSETPMDNQPENDGKPSRHSKKLRPIRHEEKLYDLNPGN